MTRKTTRIRPSSRLEKYPKGREVDFGDFGSTAGSAGESQAPPPLRRCRISRPSLSGAARRRPGRGNRETGTHLGTCKEKCRRGRRRRRASPACWAATDRAPTSRTAFRPAVTSPAPAAASGHPNRVWPGSSRRTTTARTTSVRTTTTTNRWRDPRGRTRAP